MDKTIKKLAIAAAAMVAVGLILAGAGYAAGGNQPIRIDGNGIHVGGGWGDSSGKGDATVASSGKQETFEEKLEHFTSIKTDMNLYPVELIAGDRYAIEGVYDTGLGKPEYTVEDGTLVIEERNDTIFNVGMKPGINYGGKLGVKVYYPKGAELENVSIKASAAELSFQGITADSVEFEISLGGLEVSDISAKKIKVILGAGDCLLTGLKADDLDITNQLGQTTLKETDVKTLKAKAFSGDMTLSNVTAEQGTLELDLGKLSAKNLKTQGLTAKNQSGDIILKGILQGDTDITSSLGTVFVSPGASEDQFNYELKTSLGTVKAGGNESSSSMQVKNEAKNNIKISASLGDIEVQFAE
jgi:DUF4097 and DUF4098 domain-containing protein YvlB